MSRGYGKDWARKELGVTWRDVDNWCRDIYTHWGLWAVFTVVPPLPTQRHKNAGTVVLKLYRYVDGVEVEKSNTQWTIKPGEGLSLEAIMLRMVSAQYVQLDMEIWAQERTDPEKGTAI